MRADGKNLSLVFDTIEVNCVTTMIVLDNEAADADLVTFGDVIAGDDKRWFFSITGFPDYSDGTFWTLLWTTPAFTPISYYFRPYGNENASPSQPHFWGECVVDKKPPLGGDAGTQWSFDTRLSCTANPERIVINR